MENLPQTPQTQTTVSLASQLLAEFDQRIVKVETAKTQYLSLPLSAETDQALERFIIGVKQAKGDFENKRKPITQKIQEIVKSFTSKENYLQGVIDEAQKKRNEWAKTVAEENAKREREANRERLSKEEIARFRAEIQVELASHVEAAITAMKEGMLTALRQVTKENFEEKFAKLSALQMVINPKVFSDFKTNKVSQFGANVEVLKNAIIVENKEELSNHYKSEMELYKQESLILMKQMQKDKSAKESIAVKQEEIALEAATAIDIATHKANMTLEAEKADIAFESTATDHTIEAPEARIGYEIEVLSHQGWRLIVAFWFDNCISDKLSETKTLKSMKTDVEKYSHEKGKRIESEHIRYSPTYKAVNRVSRVA